MLEYLKFKGDIMFVDRFSDEEAIEIAKRYCMMTDGPVNKYHIEDYMTKKNMIRKENSVAFYFEYYPKMYSNEAAVPETVTTVHNNVLITAPNQMFPVFL